MTSFVSLGVLTSRPEPPSPDDRLLSIPTEGITVSTAPTPADPKTLRLLFGTRPLRCPHCGRFKKRGDMCSLEVPVNGGWGVEHL